jgi:hypothetical protein
VLWSFSFSEVIAWLDIWPGLLLVDAGWMILLCEWLIFFRDARIFLVDFSWSFSFSEVVAGWIFDLDCCWWTLNG